MSSLPCSHLTAETMYITANTRSLDCSVSTVNHLTELGTRVHEYEYEPVHAESAADEWIHSMCVEVNN